MTGEEGLEPPGTVGSIGRPALNSYEPSRHRLARYGPVALWALLIFFASTSVFSGANTAEIAGSILHWLFPHASEATINFIHGVVIRKGAHFTEYAIFALLAARAFRGSSHEFLRDHWFVVTLLIVMSYALGDEFHQSFEPTRTASIYDSMIDSFGGFVALSIRAWWFRSRTPREPEQHLKSADAA